MLKLNAEVRINITSCFIFRTKSPSCIQQVLSVVAVSLFAHRNFYFAHQIYLLTCLKLRFREIGKLIIFALFCDVV